MSAIRYGGSKHSWAESKRGGENSSTSLVVMIEGIKKSIYTGIGLASLTADKIQKLATDLSKEAQLSEEEGRRLHEELQTKADESRQHLDQKIDERINQALVQLGLLKAEVKKVTDRGTDALHQLIDHRIDAALDRLGVARKEDVDSLLQRLELLEAKLHQTPTVPENLSIES